MVWLLDDYYDREHRAYHIADLGKVLEPLKLRYHGTMRDMPYDERYTEHIEPTGLLPFISLVSRGPPNMNAAAITALVDRWRPETHTFHLRAGEMTPTLQDVFMILGLPIQGEPLCMNTASDGWRQQMEALIGMAPPEPPNKKDRAPAGANYKWIKDHFAECPIGADRDTVRTYTRVYLWYVISRTLFTDSGGKLAHWCWLKALTVLEHKWSWGTAALSYLYRQLDDACRRTGTMDIGGCQLLLSVWSWERLPVGRPRVFNKRPWPHSENLNREPTWAYQWDTVSEMTNDPAVMYKQYTEELDTLTSEQVDWEPYGSRYHFGTAMGDLNPKCLEEAGFWRMRCPLICMWAVEYHMPHRVMRQFGLFQECPPDWQDTDRALHRLDRKQQRKIQNWPDHHRNHVTAFEHYLDAVRNGGHVEVTPYDDIAFNDYLRWFLDSTRIELVNRAYEEEMLDEPIVFDEVAQSQYDRLVRGGRSTSIASSLNFVRTAQKLRRLGNLLGCRDGEIATPSPSPPEDEPDDSQIPDDTILSQAKEQAHAARSAYMLKPRGMGPDRYTPEDYVNRGKKVVVESNEEPPRRSAMRRMRNDEPSSSEEEEEERPPPPPRRAVRKQPARRGRRS
ncbi:hypothetical protein ACQ4PT_045678 [Festuca glaucescens]